MSRPGPSLDHPGNRDKFLLRLGACEYAAASRNEFTERECEFIRDMRYRFDHRFDNEGLTAPWNPTVSQWNYLGNLAERVRAPEFVRERGRG